MVNLPKMSPADREILDKSTTLQVTAAMTQTASGKSPGLDRLPAEFFKHFWIFLGPDLWMLLMNPSSMELSQPHVCVQ